MDIFSEVVSLKKTDIPFPSTHQLPINPQLGVGLCDSLPSKCWSFVCLDLAQNCVRILMGLCWICRLILAGWTIFTVLILLIYEYDGGLSIFSGLLHILFSVYCIFTLVKLVPRQFYSGYGYRNGILSVISFSVCLMVVYRKTMDFFVCSNCASYCFGECVEAQLQEFSGGLLEFFMFRIK